MNVYGPFLSSHVMSCLALSLKLAFHRHQYFSKCRQLQRIHYLYILLQCDTIQLFFLWYTKSDGVTSPLCISDKANAGAMPNLKLNNSTTDRTKFMRWQYVGNVSISATEICNKEYGIPFKYLYLTFVDLSEVIAKSHNYNYHVCPMTLYNIYLKHFVDF